MHISGFDEILVVVSTASKNYKEVKNKIEKKLYKLLDEAKYKVKITADENSILNEAKEFSKNNMGRSTLFMSVGGDGSLGEAVNGLVGSDTIFSFLPNGTGNDFSRTVYPKMNLYDILDKIDHLEIEDIDLIKVNDEYTLNAFGFGLESIVLKKSLELKPKLGRFKKLSIFLAVPFVLNKLNANHYSYEYVTANGETISGKAERYVTAICNGRFYGTGFLPAPYAKINDGIAHLNSLKKDKLLKIFEFLFSYKSDKHLSLDVSINEDIVSGSIKSHEGPMLGNTDGNLRHYENLDFKVINKAIKLGRFIG